MELPEEGKTRDEIIDSYNKTLAQVVGSEEEARIKIYSMSTRHYFAFGALVSEELSYKIKELPRVRWVLPDSYMDVKNKDYGREPFINGQAVPYDPKYHEEWVRNNARANERSRCNDRPRNFDRSRNFERRRENMQNRDFQNRTPNPVPSAGPNVQGPPPPMPPAADRPNARDMNRDAGSMHNPSYQGAKYQNQGPSYQGNYAPPMHNPEFQNRGEQNPPPPSAPSGQGHVVPPYAQQPSQLPQGTPYRNQGPPSYQSSFVPNRDGSGIPGGDAYQGDGNPYRRGLLTQGRPHFRVTKLVAIREGAIPTRWVAVLSREVAASLK